MADPAPKAGAARLPLFDPLRAIAALSIVGYHGVIAGRGLPDPLGWLAPFGVQLDLGVPIFFVISGFLLYRPFAIASLARPGAIPSLSKYALGRLLRIVPAFWVALTVTIIVGRIGGFDALQFPGGEARYFAFAQVYWPESALEGMGAAWSLDTELAFYLLLPALAALVVVAGTRTAHRWRLSQIAVIGSLIAFGVLYKTVLIPWEQLGTGEDRLPWILTLPAYVDVFGAGMALAAISAWIDSGRSAGRAVEGILRRPAIFLALAAAAFLVLGLTEIRHLTGQGEYLALRGLQTTVALSLVIVVAFSPAAVISAKVFGHRALQWLGERSYSIFLIHPMVAFVVFPVLNVAESGGAIRYTLAWSGYLAGSLILSELSYRYVEVPALSLKSRLRGGISGVRGTDAAAARGR